MKRDAVKSLKFFVLAGGYGKRAQPLSLVKAKPAFPLDGTPLIQIMLNQFKKKGLHEGFINLHHLPESIHTCVEAMPDKPPVRFLYEEKLSGSRILTGALPYLADDDLLLAVNGDVFLDIPVKGMLRKILTGKNHVDGVLLVRYNKEENPGYKAILTREGIFCGRKIHDPGDTGSIGKSLMYTGVSLFKKKVVRAIADVNFFDNLERNPFKISVFIYNGIWLDIGDAQSYMEANFAYKTYAQADRAGSNSLSEHVVISPGSLVERSILWENTTIKGESLIKNCIVTGNISLEHARYENQVIWGRAGSGFKLHPLLARPGAPR
jgi:NDP-sugar pyrophosphorylase family protein